MLPTRKAPDDACPHGQARALCRPIRVLIVLLVSMSCIECVMGQVVTASVKSKLEAKRKQIIKIKDAIEAQYVVFDSTSRNIDNCFGSAGSAGLAGGKSLSGCGNELPPDLNPTCSRFLGDTKGCKCLGKRVVEKVAVKGLDVTKDANTTLHAANVACFASSPAVVSAYQSVSGSLDYENKLMYFGSVDGVMAYYPGVLWARTDDPALTNSGSKCDPHYDPRLRAWYIAGSNGPKNVVFILDTSGSMTRGGVTSRLDLLKRAAKQLMDSLGMNDFVAVVQFSDKVSTYLGNKFMARAKSGFRSSLKSFIDDLQPGGGTMYTKAFARAFEVVDTSYANNYDSSCQTIFVFLTDGESEEDPTAIILARQAAQLRKEMYMIIGLGGDVGADKPGGKKLKKLACDIGGIFEEVGDAADSSAAAQEAADNALLRAMSAFSRYLQATNALLKRDVVSYSEIYQGRNFPMDLTTVSVPVYDKRDANRWKLLGVVGIDVTVCDLETVLYKDNAGIQELPQWPEETVVTGCKCADKYTYKGVKYTSCTTEGWPNRWCGTVGCGLELPGSDLSTGKWADCKPFGVRAELEAILMEAEECKSKTWMMSSCVIEALRAPSKRCSPACSASEVSAEVASNFFDGLPGLSSGVSSDMAWAQNAGDGFFDEAEWSSNTSSCDQCLNSDMLPQCALPSKCMKSGIPSLQSAAGAANGAFPATIAYIIGGVAAALLLVAAAWGCVCRMKRASSTRVLPLPPGEAVPIHDQTPTAIKVDGYTLPTPQVYGAGAMPAAYQPPPPAAAAPQPTAAPAPASGSGIGMAVAGGLVGGAAAGAGAAAFQAGAQPEAGAQLEEGVESLADAVSGMQAPDLSALTVPAEAAELSSNIFDSTFLADVGDGAMVGLLAAGTAAPIIGQVFTLLADLKKHLDRHVEAEEECRRMSVWCMSMMAVLGKLARETSVDETSKQLLEAAAANIVKMRKLVMKRLESSAGYLGKMYNFWTSETYLRHSRIAQNGLDKAIEALSLKVAVDTKADVDKMLRKVNLLPQMNAKLDVLNSKMDAVLNLAVKQDTKTKVETRRETILEQFTIAQDDCQLEDQPFAVGGSARVFKGTFDGHPVAVKCLDLRGVPLKQRNEIQDSFMTELDIMCRLSHPNLLHVYGAITDDPTCLQLVMAFAPHGSLRDVLDKDPSTPLAAAQQLDYTTQLCRGLKHLHSKKVAHKDFKSLNVLLDGTVLKISDFNSSKEETGATMAGDTSSSYGTPAWTAPESFLGVANASPYAADVYSLGVVFWEIATRRVPWPGKNITEIISAVGFRQERPGVPQDSAIPQIEQAIASCWKQAPEERMTVQELLGLVAGANAAVAQDLPPPSAPPDPNTSAQEMVLRKTKTSTASMPLQPLLAGWEEAVDSATGKTYYMNHETKTTQWERPT